MALMVVTTTTAGRIVLIAELTKYLMRLVTSLLMLKISMAVRELIDLTRNMIFQ